MTCYEIVVLTKKGCCVSFFLSCYFSLLFPSRTVNCWVGLFLAFKSCGGGLFVFAYANCI